VGGHGDPTKAILRIVAQAVGGKMCRRHRALPSSSAAMCWVAFRFWASEKQIGFGRFVTDYATFAYRADVFVAWGGFDGGD